MAQRDVTGSKSQGNVPQTRASLVCPSSAPGSDGLAEQSRQLRHDILLATNQHFFRRTAPSPELRCGAAEKMRHASTSNVERSAREHARLIKHFALAPQMIH